MDSVKLAQAIVRKAKGDKSNVERYDKAITALAERERAMGNTEEADFISQQMMEALYVAIG